MTPYEHYLLAKEANWLGNIGQGFAQAGRNVGQAAKQTWTFARNQGQEQSANWFGRQLGENAIRGYRNEPLSAWGQLKAFGVGVLSPTAGQAMLASHSGGRAVGGAQAIADWARPHLARFGRPKPQPVHPGLLIAGGLGAGAAGYGAARLIDAKQQEAQAQRQNALLSRQLTPYEEAPYQKVAQIRALLDTERDLRAGLMASAKAAAARRAEAWRHGSREAEAESEGEPGGVKRAELDRTATRLLRAIEPKYGGCCQDLVEGKALDNAHARGDHLLTENDVQKAWREHGRPYLIREKLEKSESLPHKLASRIFLGGAVSGPQANWREGIKRKLWEKGHSVIDPRKPFVKWNPLSDIYKELAGMMRADKVFFFRPGGFSEREKAVLEAAKKPYQVVRKPEEIVQAVEQKRAYDAMLPVDLRGAGTQTPSAFPVDQHGQPMTTLRGMLEGDLAMITLARYLRDKKLSEFDPILLSLLEQAGKRALTRRP